MIKLLLVDDDEELCMELEEVLKEEGFKVDMVFDGQESLRHIQEKQYAIIILDLKLPGLNGYAVLQEIRQMHKPDKVLVLSGRPLGKPLLQEEGVSRDEEEKILNLADAVMNKPFMVDDLIKKIKTLI
jgi:DNA-binding response OmpR family regulator